MNELDSGIAQEIDDEALFRLAEGEPHEFSPEYQEKMRRLYKKAGAHPRRKMTPIRRIVAVAAIIAVLTGTTAAATFWEDIRQFFVTTFGEYVELKIEPDVEPNEVNLENFPEEWESFWYPNNDLNGYSLLSAETLGERKVISFLNGENRLQLSQWPSENKITTDRDGIPCNGIIVGGCKAYAMEKKIENGIRRTITWTSGGTTFQLYSSLSFDEMVNIGNNLVLVER